MHQRAAWSHLLFYRCERELAHDRQRSLKVHEVIVQDRWVINREKFSTDGAVWTMPNTKWAMNDLREQSYVSVRLSDPCAWTSGCWQALSFYKATDCYEANAWRDSIKVSWTVELLDLRAKKSLSKCCERWRSSRSPEGPNFQTAPEEDPLRLEEYSYLKSAWYV